MKTLSFNTRRLCLLPTLVVNRDREEDYDGLRFALVHLDLYSGWLALLRCFCAS